MKYVTLEMILNLSLTLVVMHEQSLRYLQTQSDRDQKNKSNSVNGEQVLALETCQSLSVQLSTLTQYFDISIPAAIFKCVGVD